MPFGNYYCNLSFEFVRNFGCFILWSPISSVIAESDAAYAETIGFGGDICVTRQH
jgi:hypothetical protein